MIALDILNEKQLGAMAQLADEKLAQVDHYNASLHSFVVFIVVIYKLFHFYSRPKSYSMLYCPNGHWQCSVKHLICQGPTQFRK